MLQVSPAAAQREAEALAEVRSEIEALETRIARQSDARDEGARELRRIETQLAEAATELERARTRLADQREALAALAKERRQTQARLANEEDALAASVRMSYMTGRGELLKLLLSQESPAQLGRMLAYYDYLNRARAGRIGDINDAIERLGRIADETAAGEAELARLEEQQLGELRSLEQARAERREFLRNLESQLEDSGSQIERLRGEEERLADLLSDLDEVLAGFPVDSDAPFSAARGSLAWPVEGPLISNFGSPRGGDAVRWNGVVIESESGSPVRSVYHGRVVFSDWLQGLGLLIIVDHGEGFMSLYGHNQALLKDSGDWVEPGEIIAEVGDTGGQTSPSLYFALRRDGTPLDPGAWMREAR
jgi:septal ring factor EnvC (AmiA/AmiB activator)